MQTEDKSPGLPIKMPNRVKIRQDGSILLTAEERAILGWNIGDEIEKTVDAMHKTFMGEKVNQGESIQ